MLLQQCRLLPRQSHARRGSRRQEVTAEPSSVFTEVEQKPALPACIVRLQPPFIPYLSPGLKLRYCYDDRKRVRTWMGGEEASYDVGEGARQKWRCPNTTEVSIRRVVVEVEHEVAGQTYRLSGRISTAYLSSQAPSHQCVRQIQSFHASTFDRGPHFWNAALDAPSVGLGTVASQKKKKKEEGEQLCWRAGNMLPGRRPFELGNEFLKFFHHLLEFVEGTALTRAADNNCNREVC